MSERGRYTVFEGSDGTGKSYQAIEYAKHLQRLGEDPLLVFNDETGRIEPIQEPGGTEKANALRRIIKDKTITRTAWQNVVWFTEARKSNWEELIEPALDAGRPVPTARNFVSTIAYQGYGEGVPIKDILDYTREEVGERYMAPDYLAILALRSEIERKNRIANAARTRTSDMDTFESMPKEFQENMQSGYVGYARQAGIEMVEVDGTHDFVEGYLWARAYDPRNTQ